MNISKHNLYGYLIFLLRVQSPWHFWKRTFAIILSISCILTLAGDGLSVVNEDFHSVII